MAIESAVGKGLSLNIDVEPICIGVGSTLQFSQMINHIALDKIVLKNYEKNSLNSSLS
jgi:hypothetical protein